MTIGRFTIRMIPRGDQRALYIDCDAMEIDATPDVSVSDIADALRDAGVQVADTANADRLGRLFGGDE